jgi:hypothetical protein
MPAVVTGMPTINASSHECKRKKKRKAERRTTLIRILRTLRCGSPFAKGARLPAFHHGSCQRDASPQGSASGQASWDVVSTGVIRCLLSQSSDSTSRTGRNAGEHDARSRPGVAVTSRRSRAPHPVPISRGHRLTSFTANESEAPYSNRCGNVKANHFRARLFKQNTTLRGPDFFAERTECVSLLKIRSHVIVRSSRDNVIQGPLALSAGLLRGACHRAGHFGPDPLARNDAYQPMTLL